MTFCAFLCFTDSPGYAASHYWTNGAVPAYFILNIHFLVTFRYKIQTIGKTWLLKEPKGNPSYALEPSMELPGHPVCRFSVPRQTLKLIPPYTEKKIILKREKVIWPKRQKIKKEGRGGGEARRGEGRGGAGWSGAGRGEAKWGEARWGEASGGKARRVHCSHQLQSFPA